MNITPRKYQSETLESIFDSLDRGIKRQLAVLFTGAGKTILAILLLKKMLAQGKKVLILVDQEDLVWQWKERAHEVDPSLVVGIEKAEYKANKKSNIVIASIQSLGRKGSKRIKKFDPDYFDLCLVDEAHKSIAETWFRVLNYFGFGDKNFNDKNLLVSLTATPYRTSGESLGILYDDIVANYDIRYGISKGWLTDIQIYDVDTSTDISSVQSYKDDFNMKQLTETVDNPIRNEEIVKAYKNICDGQQAIVYCASVDHAYHVAEIFKANGITAETIEANTDKTERKDWMKEFRNGNIDVLCNFATLTTGIDFPELSTIILARPIKSKLLFTQIIGRVLRPSATAYVDDMFSPDMRKESIEQSDKPYAKIIDLHDTTGKHNVAHIPSLFGLHNELKIKEPKQFFKEVVEPLEQIQKEQQIDVSTIKDLDEIDLIVKNRKYEIKSLALKPEIEQFTNRAWIEVGDDSYEIIYGDEHKVLLIEKDSSKGELLDKDEWNLLEYDTKSNITKTLQTFNSLSGAFKIADQYADQSGWNSQYLEKAEWQSEGVTKKQLDLLKRFYQFKYRKGHPKAGQVKYSKFKLLESRYEDTNIRKIHWKDTGETLDKGTASKLISQKFNN